MDRDPRRRFTASERAALYLADGGRCALCGVELEPGWHADHRDPHAHGGVTDVINGQALCPPCNLKKGDRAEMVTHHDQLRDWQREALRRFRAHTSSDFLVCATPAAGKTRFALTLARQLLDERAVSRIAVVVPTDALRSQWADEAATVGIDLMPATSEADYDKSGYDGCAVTYHQLARGAGADLLRHATRKPTLALIDEIHHVGESRSWGDGLQRALEHATWRVGLTGTPWRNDKSSPIPYVRYGPTGEVEVDSSYEYGEAVADGVCRRVEFHAYDGEARWIDCGKLVTAEIGADLPDDDVPAVLDTILSPDREWMPGVLTAAVKDLQELRREVPDAGGLVIAERQWQAERYAQILRELTGQTATVVISDDKTARDRIDEFRRGSSPWLVAVRMVSEGVDIKRLAVGVYAARARTPLFFRQVVGRFVRTREGEEINAKLFIPAIPTLMRHAKAIEDELRHQLDLDTELDEKTEREQQPGRQGALDLRQPLSTSEARFSSSIFGGNQAPAAVHSRAEQWCRDRGIPIMFAPNVVPDILTQEAGSPPAPPTTEAAADDAPPLPSMPRARRERMLRSEINTLVGKVAYRAGISKKEINRDLIRDFGPRGACSIDQLEEIHARLVKWFGEL